MFGTFQHVDLSYLNLRLLNVEQSVSAFKAHRVGRLQTPKKLIEEIDSQPDPPPRCPPGRIKINVRLSNQSKPLSGPQFQSKMKSLSSILPTTKVGTSPLIKGPGGAGNVGQGVTVRVANQPGYTFQMVPHQGSVKGKFIHEWSITFHTFEMSLYLKCAITSLKCIQVEWKKK